MGSRRTLGGNFGVGFGGYLSFSLRKRLGRRRGQWFLSRNGRRPGRRGLGCHGPLRSGHDQRPLWLRDHQAGHQPAQSHPGEHQRSGDGPASPSRFGRGRRRFTTRRMRMDQKRFARQSSASLSAHYIRCQAGARSSGWHWRLASAGQPSHQMVQIVSDRR